MNCPTEKSLTTEAAFPYFPRIPTPTFATWIIPTSFPPSPIANTIPFKLSFTNYTIEDFSLGEERQKMIEDILVRDSLIRWVYSHLRNFWMLWPSIINENMRVLFLNFCYWISLSASTIYSSLNNYVILIMTAFSLIKLAR